ncbi:GyrI-like domain-containing protein [Beutenbergia cavernae]|uniref:GyrI-like domain-containing protein n=1 Tax=Beutenbergia cavernae TaxID=84757 RepID=UPI00019AD921|nr:GyrI-like domain-containing protein [Beutenbergia cavernae]
MPFDVKRELPALYAPKNRAWDLLDVPPQQFLAVDGEGDPNTSEAYARAVEALYAVAYTLRFASKRDGFEFVVGPLEGLWWSPDPAVFTARAKEKWHWRMLITLPERLTGAQVTQAAAAAQAKKGLPAISDVRLERMHEGLCAQVLHLGSYDDETPVLAELHERYLPQLGLVPTGHHHEIYLGDPRRTAPEKLRTVIRQPVAPAP